MRNAHVLRTCTRYTPQVVLRVCIHGGVSLNNDLRQSVQSFGQVIASQGGHENVQLARDLTPGV